MILPLNNIKYTQIGSKVNQRGETARGVARSAAARAWHPQGCQGSLCIPDLATALRAMLFTRA